MKRESIFVFVTLLAGLTIGELIRISPQSQDGLATPTFFLNAKSANVVAKKGDTVDLSCQTSSPWQLCSWQHPEGDWCDRLSVSKYLTSCQNHDRVRYEVNEKNYIWVLGIMFPVSESFQKWRESSRPGIGLLSDCCGYESQ